MKKRSLSFLTPEKSHHRYIICILQYYSTVNEEYLNLSPQKCTAT